MANLSKTMLTALRRAYNEWPNPGSKTTVEALVARELLVYAYTTEETCGYRKLVGHYYEVTPAGLAALRRADEPRERAGGTVGAGGQGAGAPRGGRLALGAGGKL